MTTFHEGAPVAIRSDLTESHQRAWEHLGNPGTWLDGPTRIAIAAETRAANNCDLCRKRKAAVSPNAVDGEHATAGNLAPALVDVVHRVVTDPGRLSESWYRQTLAKGVEDTEYVETISIVGIVRAVDSFARAAGVAIPDLTEPRSGSPTRVRPKVAKQGPAWVPWILPDDVTDDEKGLYDHGQSNVTRALSLVPASALGFFDVVLAQYLPGTKAMLDFGNEYRAITHPQIELLGARVSALNQCVY